MVRLIETHGESRQAWWHSRQNPPQAGGLPGSRYSVRGSVSSRILKTALLYVKILAYIWYAYVPYYIWYARTVPAPTHAHKCYEESREGICSSISSISIYTSRHSGRSRYILQESCSQHL